MASSSRRNLPSRNFGLQEDITTAESDESDDDADYEVSGESEVSDFSNDSDDETAEPRRKRPRPRPNSEHAADFQWNRDDFTPKLHTFNSNNSGIVNCDLTEDSSIREYFECVFPQDLCQKIAEQTNAYFDFVVTDSPPTQGSRLQKWYQTDWEEIYLFLAVSMLMSRNKRLKMSECWSNDPLLRSPIFSETMPRDRYQLLLRVLHFCSNEQQVPGDRLFKIDMVLSALKERFHAVFVPYQDLCIDESLVLFKGRLSFKQYIKTKRHRFGIKLFVLCDVKTDYILDVIIYTGGTTRLAEADKSLGISGAVVQTLMEPYLEKGHTLFTDNWYSSPTLSRYLYEHKTNSCGTVRRNRKGMPKLNDKLDVGERCSAHTDQMMAMKWRDRREVFMLTTLHKDTVKETGRSNYHTGEPIMKPACVVDYNKGMGTVDKTDMLLSSVECARKTMKWYKKIFFHLVDLSMLNAHALYKTKTNKKTPVADFQLELIRELITKYIKQKGNPQGGRPSSGDTPLRLTARHFPSHVPPKPGGKARLQRRCHVCKNTSKGIKKRKETSYMCAPCDVGLCLFGCFEAYHTQKNF